jgi:drug/metabolite transporter (DMT)-like permease
VSRLAIAAAAATGIQVGAAIVATRYVVHETGPASLALLRYAIGVCCLVPPIVLTRAWPRFAARDLVPIAALGIGQFGLLIALLNFGLRYIPAGRAALLFASFPLMTLTIAALLGRERMTLAKTGGVLLTILGVGLALGERALERGGAGSAWLGEAAVLASALCGALCSVLCRPLLQRYPTLPVSAVAMLAAVLFLAGLAAGEGFFAAFPPAISAGGWAAIVFIGVSSGVFYFVWLWALAHAPPTRVTIFLALSPVTAALLGALLLGEAITLGAMLGLASVAAGLFLAQRGPG